MHRHWTFHDRSVRGKEATFCFLLAATLVGCSDSSATVNGKVMVNGKEVTEGTVVFSPTGADGNSFPGKPGMAGIQSDGSYSLELVGGSNGLASRFAVRFTPPPPKPPPGEVDFSNTKDMFAPYQGLIPNQSVVDVKPGSNVINIELIPTPQK